MEDLYLLRSQIQDSCKLALPEGLKDLMSDISREVLRTQPSDLYLFIADYLSAMLVTRETLSIACQVCRDVCECTCQPELEEQLKNIGLDGDDLEAAMNVVMEYFDKGGVNEGNLLMALLNKTSIEDYKLPAVRDAVRTAFMRHQLHLRGNEESLAENIVRGQNAVQNTLKIYEKLHDNEDIEEWAATKIQAFYRGHQVRCKQSATIATFRAKVKILLMKNTAVCSPTKGVVFGISKQQEIDESSNTGKNSPQQLLLSPGSCNNKKYIECSPNSSVMTFPQHKEREEYRRFVNFTPLEPSSGEENEIEISIEEEESVDEESVDEESVEEEIEEYLLDDENSDNEVLSNTIINYL